VFQNIYNFKKAKKKSTRCRLLDQIGDGESDQEATLETGQGFRPPSAGRSASVAPGALEAWRTKAPRRQVVTDIGSGYFQCLLRDVEATATSRGHNNVLSALSSYRWCVELAEGACSCVSRRSHRI
jgi:hypothetical protein